MDQGSIRAGQRYLPGVRRLVVLAAVLLASSHARAEGLFLGDEHRYTQKNVVVRAAMDVVAIPANAVRWEPADWAQFAGWSLAVGGLMFAGDPVADVQLDRWISRNLDAHVPLVWGAQMQLVLWSSIAVGGLGTWGWSTLAGNDDIAQGISLMAEALAVSQVYHLTLKLLIGREGPDSDGGNALILGPAHSFRLFPAGTPSGHAATLFSLMSAGFAYFQPPLWAQVLGASALGVLISFHVINHRHFLSDSLWGSAMGWYVGQWVVRHRASWLFGDRRAPAVTVVPFSNERASGIAISGAF